MSNIHPIRVQNKTALGSDRGRVRSYCAVCTPVNWRHDYTSVPCKIRSNEAGITHFQICENKQTPGRVGVPRIGHNRLESA